MKTQTKLLCALLLYTVAPLAAQVVPEYINYQGLLKAGDGSPLATGNYTMEFNVYDQANLGNKVWGPFLFDSNIGEGHGAIVPVVNGSFNVIIGPRDTSGASITNAFYGPSRFIEIKVNGGAPILPRQQFLSTAYALQSQRAQQADVASDLVQQVADILCPPGTIVAFGGTSIPSGWLLCDGANLSRATYARLFAAIGTAWGNSTSGSTNFNLPDLRGMFLRGVTGLRTGTYADPERTNRTSSATGGNSGNAVGSVQSDGTRPHNHPLEKTIYVHYRSFTGDSGSDWPLKNNANSGGSVFSSVTATNLTDARETRPNNAYVNYIIKY